MSSKIDTKVGRERVNLDLAGVEPPQGPRPEIIRHDIVHLDQGFTNRFSDFETPDGKASYLQDIRFENGGIRKDFGLVNVGAAAEARIVDFAKYEFVNPLTEARVIKPTRIYRETGAGKAEVQFLAAGVWGGTQTSAANLENIYGVKAHQIADLLIFADGQRIHAYSESTELTLVEQNFTNAHAGTVGTGVNGELILVNEEHRINTLSQTPQSPIEVNYRVEAVKGLGYMHVAIEYYVGAWVESKDVGYLIFGPQVWAHESHTIDDPAALAATDVRVRIKSITSVFSFTTVAVKVAGFGATGVTDPAPGVVYWYYPAVSVKFDVLSADAPKASFVFPFEDRVIALGGADEPKRIAGSADGLPREWRIRDQDLAFTGAFEFVILDTVSDPTDDMIAGGKVANNVAAIFRKKSILRMEETGNLELPVRISDWIDEIGTLSPLSVTQVPDGLCFIGHDWMPYYFSGATGPRPIGADIYERLLEDVRDGDLYKIVAKYDDKLREWWMGIAEDGAAGITSWWIFDLGRYFASGGQQTVWRYRLVNGSSTCEPQVTAPPTNPGPGTEPSPPTESEEPPPFIPPPPVPEPILFNGKPFENIYADGHNWIGNLFSTGTINWTKIFDVLTGDEVKVLYEEGLTNNFGYGYAYHPVRKEMWELGEVGGVTKIAVYDTLTLLHKVTHTYTGYDSETPYSIEYCPFNGNIFAAMRKNPETEATVVEINPSTGLILRSWTTATFEADETPCEDLAAASEFQMMWHPVDELFYCGKQRDYIWTIDPDSGAKTRMSGAVGGLIDSGEFVCEQEYSAADNRIYLVPDARHAVYRYSAKPAGDCINFNTGLSAWKSYAGGQADPKAFQALAINRLDGMAVCRGDTSLIFSDPTKTGRVTVYDVHHGGILRDFIIKFNPARMSYVPETDSICVVSYWKQDTEWYVIWLPLSGVENLPDPIDDPEVPIPDDPPVPAPTPEPEPDPTPPPAGAPTITAARDYCTDGLVETPPASDLWDGTIASGVEIDYTDDAGHIGDPVEILVYPVGANPSYDAISVRGGVDVDADTIRLQTFSETHTQVSSIERPVCPGNTNFGARDDFDQFWDVYLRYTGDTLLSNKVTVRVRNPRKYVTEDPSLPVAPYDPPFWTSGLGSGYCSTGQNLVTNKWETRVLANLNCWAANYGNDGYGLLPVEYAEFDTGADPDLDTPIRTHIMTNRGPTYPYSWLVYYDELPIGGGQKTSCGSVGGVTRDYYARHIIDGNGTYSPWSAKLATMTHRPPVRIPE